MSWLEKVLIDGEIWVKCNSCGWSERIKRKDDNKEM